MEEIKKELSKTIKYVERETGYFIYLVGKKSGSIARGVCNYNGATYKVAKINGCNTTEVLHELGHLMDKDETIPISKLSLLLRELRAWGIAEQLAFSFDLDFDEVSFDEGFSSYIFTLLLSQERPSLGWLSQLIGE